MTALLWLLLLPVLSLVALACSPKLRKNAFIWFSYATITGWYYFRVLQKKYTDSGKGVSSPSNSPPSSINTKRPPLSCSSPRAFKGPKDTDVVYFESREVVERRQHEQHERFQERSGVSERSSRMSDSESSGGSDVSGARTPNKHKRGLFHSQRKAAAEEAMRRVSDASSADLLTTSGASETSGSLTPGRNSATRRTYTGRKKPVSWAD